MPTYTPSPDLSHSKNISVSDSVQIRGGGGLKKALDTKRGLITHLMKWNHSLSAFCEATVGITGATTGKATINGRLTCGGLTSTLTLGGLNCFIFRWQKQNGLLYDSMQLFIQQTSYKSFQLKHRLRSNNRTPLPPTPRETSKRSRVHQA